MSTEWFTVAKNNKVSKVPAVEKPVVKKPYINYREQAQKREDEKKQKWEASRQRKIDEYNSEFPLLPGSKDLITDAKKVAFIDARIAAKKEADKKAYLEREARRQARQQRHVQNMIEKWGAHRWFIMVEDTKDDCATAQELRNEHEWKETCRYYDEMERFEKECREYSENRAKYIAEMTANMSESQKQEWIDNYNFEEDEYDMVVCEEAQRMYDKQKQEDDARLEAWNLKNKKK